MKNIFKLNIFCESLYPNVRLELFGSPKKSKFVFHMSFYLKFKFNFVF